jgi:hypothetical protein
MWDEVCFKAVLQYLTVGLGVPVETSIRRFDTRPRYYECGRDALQLDMQPVAFRRGEEYNRSQFSTKFVAISSADKTKTDRL